MIDIEVRDAILKEFNEPRVNRVLEDVARETGEPYPEIVSEMWRMVDDGLLSYGTDARLRKVEG